ncbi:MAG: ABC transporter permease [Eubacteriales bacterium]|nr:ABC transporter permease [Clostridia bacterium]MDY2845698.1 ABC transporter permease [Eubacteriales bacterium]
MAKYLLKRILHAILSVIAVVMIVMILIYSLMNRQLIFSSDPVYAKTTNNAKQTYMLRKWEEYGYLDYVTYADYLQMLTDSGEIDEDTRAKVVNFARKAGSDSEEVQVYIDKFNDYYTKKGYTVNRLDAVTAGKKLANGGQQQYYAYKDKSLVSRLVTYFTSIISVDNVHYVEEDLENRGITFTTHDPVYGGEKFSPAIMGNGTKYKYLLYCNDKFPWIHQNLVTINLGKSYSVNMGIDVFTTMITSQGSYVNSVITYPSGLTEESADDLHMATYAADSLDSSIVFTSRYTDHYTNVPTVKGGMSKMGYSFSIGICAVVISYLLGVPLGILMARKKDKFIDKLGTIYIIFIIAVPSLAYIFLFKAIGYKMGLPTVFNVDSSSKLMYVLPVVSLSLPSIASLMKWLRRYMIDQMNSDYVKFARSGGLSESEIFSKHILKNAIIPIVHGIPGSILGALTGAIITERVYVVPGAGNLLTQAINKYDNSVIVGVTLYYAILSVTSLILGDILMSMVDPRISFSSKAR